MGRPLTVREQAITVTDLLTRVACETATPLACDSNLGKLQVTVYATSCPAAELLARLSDLVGVLWESADNGSDPGYRMAGRRSEPSPVEVEERMLGLEEARERSECRGAREVRAARVAQYEAALSLSRTDLLSAFEQADPWVCADLLDRCTGGMLRVLAWLSSGQRNQLLSEGRVAFPVRDLPTPLRRHLGEWAKGRWGFPGGAGLAIDPDRLPRFERPEDRWPNAVVRLTWVRDTLQLQLVVPDVYTFRTTIARLPEGSDAAARRRLATLGVAAGGSGTGRTVKGAATAAIPGRGVADEAPTRAAGQSTDPRPGRFVDMTSFAGRRVALPEALSLAADQCGLRVLATCPPREMTPVIEVQKGTSSEPLEEVLERLRRARGGLCSWRLTEDWLLLEDEGADLALWADPPKEVVERWRARLGGTEPIPLADLAALAALAASLNPLQVGRLVKEVRALEDVPLSGLALYGRLERAQQDTLQRGESVAASALAAAGRRAMLRRSQVTRPWFTEADLAAASLRLVPLVLCTEEPGVSLLLEYHHPDSPRDRDVVFVAPRTFRPQGARDAEK